MNIKASTFALAVTAALSSSGAFAQSADVTLYGFLNMSVESVWTTGGTSSNSPKMARVSSNPSWLGVRGSEALGGGWAAFFQIESGFAADTGGGTFATRDSGVGLRHQDYGAIALGNWNSPIKYTSIRADPWFAFSFAGYDSIINSPGFNVGQQAVGAGGVASTVSAFDLRLPNSVNYWSPVVSGFSTRLAITANENKGQISVAPKTVNPFIWGGAVTYENGPFWVSYGFESHRDYFGLNNMVASVAPSFSSLPFATTNTGTHSQDRGHRLSGAYTFGNTTLAFVGERLEYREFGTTQANELTKYRRDAIFVSALHRIGNGQIMAAYARANSGHCETVAPGCDSSDFGASQLSLGYYYLFSKRTKVGLQYAQVDNNRRGAYGFGNNPIVGTTVGATHHGFGAIIQHYF